MDNIKVTMTIKEIKRVEVMTWVETGKITGRQAAEIMGISLRQTKADHQEIPRRRYGKYGSWEPR